MNWQVIKRIYQYIKPNRLSFFLSLALAMIGTGIAVFAPSVTGQITTQLYNGLRNNHFDWNTITFLAILLVGVYVVGRGLVGMANFILARVTSKAIEGLRQDISKKVHRLPLNFYDTRTRGEILSTVTNDVDTINNFMGEQLTEAMNQFIMIVGIFLMMLTINGWLTLVAVLMIPISLLASAGTMKYGQQKFIKQQELLGKFNGYIEEMYNGQNVIQSFNYQERAKVKFNQLNDELQDTAEKAETYASLIMPIMKVVNNAGYVISSILGCYFALQGQMTVGNVQAMLQYTQQFNEPFSSLAGMVGAFSSAMAAGQRIFGILDETEEVADKTSAQTIDTKGHVEFKHVKFGYSPDNLLMQDVNIEIQPGQKVAIVGPTGAGKTTLINLLMRFYEINDGQILIDGVDIKDMSREQLRSQFSMVLQDTWLFEGTILENLQYGREGVTKEEAVAAAKSASAHNFIKTLPNSYQMILKNNGENISQGERQLLTIARAIAADAKMLILDEATSNVDTYTEQVIQQAMAKLMAGRTSFVIAHRLSTIKDSDLILYMENGDIKEAGSHDELMALGGKYETLYNSQFA